MSTERPAAAPKLVLIVEDEEPIAEALAYLVREAGHAAAVAQQGQAALELARRHRPDLVITDLMMPRMDGAELIAALQGMWESARPPIVLTTAAASRHSAQVGADVVLPKPFDVDQVEALLRRFLDDR